MFGLQFSSAITNRIDLIFFFGDSYSMGPGLSYWIVAWTMMGLAFTIATGAILVGALRLDRYSELRNRRK